MAKTPTEEEIKANASRQLVRLADLMEGAEGAYLKELQKEYKAYVRILYPNSPKKPAAPKAKKITLAEALDAREDELVQRVMDSYLIDTDNSTYYEGLTSHEQFNLKEGIRATLRYLATAKPEQDGRR